MNISEPFPAASLGCLSSSFALGAASAPGDALSGAQPIAAVLERTRTLPAAQLLIEGVFWEGLLVKLEASAQVSFWSRAHGKARERLNAEAR